MNVEHGNGTGGAGEQQPPNAPPEGKAGEPAKDLDYYKADAVKARESRDKAKAEARELQAQLDELTSAAKKREEAEAVASGDLAKQLELAQQRYTELEQTLTSERARHRSDGIMAQVLGQIPESGHRLAKTLLTSHASTLDDGKADPAEVVKGSVEFLQDLAPQLFTAQPGGGGASAPKQAGRIPREGGSSRPDFAKQLAKVRSAGRIGG